MSNTNALRANIKFCLKIVSVRACVFDRLINVAISNYWLNPLHKQVAIWKTEGTVWIKQIGYWISTNEREEERESALKNQTNVDHCKSHGKSLTSEQKSEKSRNWEREREAYYWIRIGSCRSVCKQIDSYQFHFSRCILFGFQLGSALTL